MKTMKKAKTHPLIFGTLLLTATGLISRVIGFFYRIYLSRLFGEEGMGIYQLLGPVLSLSFSLTAAGYQTAISKIVAEQTAREKQPSLRPLAVGLSISLPLSLLGALGVYYLADPISVRLLQEARTAPMLRILAFSLPFAAIHACINGHFYGIKKASIPSATQLLEQITRVGCVYLMSAKALAAGRSPDIAVAVLGLTIGELASMLVAAAAAWRYLPDSWQETFRSGSHAGGSLAGKSLPCHLPKYISRAGSPRTSTLYRQLLAMALPLTANRIVLNLLQSVESVSIPSCLRLYGYDNVTALSVYGVLTGMAMPFIFFPNALTSSVAVLLLPMISENNARGDMKAVRSATVRTVKYCGLMGICCMAVFVLFGNWAGSTLFHSPLAGYFIQTLGFICPFLYLDTTLSSILQGLGMAGRIFLMNVACLLIRLGFVFLAVPRVGIKGYLWGILAGQLTLGILYLGCLYRFLKKHTRS